jgi:hypothetical protein
MSTTQPNEPVQPAGREPATVRIAMWSARHRWPVTGLWFVFTIGLLQPACPWAGSTPRTPAVTNERGLGSADALDVFNASGRRESEQFLVVIDGGPVRPVTRRSRRRS